VLAKANMAAALPTRQVPVEESTALMGMVLSGRQVPTQYLGPAATVMTSTSRQLL
jgi:hypothetical protein